MVGHLAGLKLRLLWNGLRKDWQRRIGFPAAVAMLAWAGAYLARHYRAQLATLTGPEALEYTLWAALALWAVWVALPVVIFPLDENLDPQQFALAPVKPTSLVVGLGVSALIAPSAVIPFITIGSNVAEFSAVWPAALVGGVLMLTLMVVSGQLFTTVMSAVLRTRRGRDMSMLIVAGIGLSGFGVQQVVRSSVDELGLSAAVAAHGIHQLAWLLPPVAAQRVVTDAVAGSPLTAAGWALVASAWVVVLATLWHRLLRWMLTTPTESAAPAALRRGRGMATVGRWTPRSVLARKELRFYLRDPRQRLVWTGAVIFLGLGAASVIVGTSGLGAFRDREWLPLMAPVLVLFVGLPIALNMFGWERNAASFLFVLPVRPRHMIMGKNLAVATAITAETAVMSVILAAMSGSWSILGFLPSLVICAIGCQLAVGNIVSVITPLRLPREGTDVFAQATEQGCLAIVAQLGSFILIGFLLVLPAAVMVLTVEFGQVLPAWFAHLFTIAWGLSLYGISLWIAGVVLRRRVPEVVQWVQVV